jgi:hypothetical protein
VYLVQRLGVYSDIDVDKGQSETSPWISVPGE